MEIRYYSEVLQYIINALVFKILECGIARFLKVPCDASRFTTRPVGSSERLIIILDRIHPLKIGLTARYYTIIEWRPRWLRCDPYQDSIVLVYRTFALVFIYRIRLRRRVALAIMDSEVIKILLVGDAKCGKTTFLSLVASLDPQPR